MQAALTASTDCLNKDWRPISWQRRSRGTAERRILTVLIESVISRSRSTSTITIEVQAAQRAIEYRRLSCERAYRLLSTLYGPAGVPPLPSLHAASASLLDALDATEAIFVQAPFAISPQANARTLILNQSRNSAEQHATTMEHIGTRFVDKTLSGQPGVTELGDVQYSVLEHVLHGFVGAVNDLPEVRSLLRGNDGMEGSAFDEALAHLQMALEDAQACRKTAKFSIAFLGMVNAGKSLFLNALIGRTILPHDGMTIYPFYVLTVHAVTIHFQSIPINCLAMSTSSCRGTKRTTIGVRPTPVPPWSRHASSRKVWNKNASIHPTFPEHSGFCVFGHNGATFHSGRIQPAGNT